MSKRAKREHAHRRGVLAGILAGLFSGLVGGRPGGIRAALADRRMTSPRAREPGRTGRAPEPPVWIGHL